MDVIEEKKEKENSNQNLNGNTSGKENQTQNQKQNENEKVKTLGEKIVDGRKDKHLSQEKFAEKMGCTRQMVSRWETNQAVPRTTTMKRISSVLNIPIQDLLADNKSPKNKNGKPVAKSLNYKVVLKYVLITAIILGALYFLYAGYKFLVLNGITSKVAEYKNLDNYYFKMESYINNDLNEVKEVWYKDGLYKIANTAVLNSISNTSTTYLDINEGYRYIVDDQEKMYKKAKLFSTDTYEDGSYMYSLFPLIIDLDKEKIIKNAFNNSFIFSYYKKGYLILRMNNEKIRFNKDSLLPAIHSVVMKENSIIQENYDFYNIELGIVTNNDVEISNEYKLMN